MCKNMINRGQVKVEGEAGHAATQQMRSRPSGFWHKQNGDDQSVADRRILGEAGHTGIQQRHSRPSGFWHEQNGDDQSVADRRILGEAGQAATQQRHSRPVGFWHDQNGDDQSVADRRILRAQYRAVKADIAERSQDPEGFDHVFGNIKDLYSEVSRPREQIADAEALFDITASLLASVKDIRGQHRQRASELVSCIIRNFETDAVTSDQSGPEMDWERLGHEACSIFSDAPAMTTMIGPLESRQKQRKTPQRRPKDRAIETVRPEELKESTDSATMTDKNMEIMFQILKRLKSVYLEEIVLNRHSFSQTVENIFALSFLVKDGRAEIAIKDGRHIVGPMNFPSQHQREQGKGSMNQFVFRFDFKDWQGMKEIVEEGREQMPHRVNMVEGTRGH